MLFKVVIVGGGEEPHPERVGCARRRAEADEGHEPRVGVAVGVAREEESLQLEQRLVRRRRRGHGRRHVEQSALSAPKHEPSRVVPHDLVFFYSSPREGGGEEGGSRRKRMRRL